MQNLFFPDITGNESLRALLGGDIRSNRLGHAYILEGPEGSGRHALALRIAAALSCERRHDAAAPLPCGQCRSCRKILAEPIRREESLPPFRFHGTDVLVVRHDPEKKTKNIPVSTIQEDVIPNTWIAPEENAKKVYVIEDLETSRWETQNALLIPLEDPPAYVLFLLIVEDARGLLETIRSRVPLLKMETFTADAIREFVLSSPAVEAAVKSFVNSHHDAFEETVQLSGGTIGKTLSELKRLSGGKNDESRFHVLRGYALGIASLLFSPDVTQGTELVRALSGKGGLQREDVLDMLRMVQEILRDLIVRKKNAEVPEQFLLSSEMKDFPLGSVSVAKILAAQSEVMKAYEDVAAMAAVTTVLTSLIIK